MPLMLMVVAMGPYITHVFLETLSCRYWRPELLHDHISLWQLHLLQESLRLDPESGTITIADNRYFDRETKESELGCKVCWSHCPLQSSSWLWRRGMGEAQPRLTLPPPGSLSGTTMYVLRPLCRGAYLRYWCYFRHQKNSLVDLFFCGKIFCASWFYLQQDWFSLQLKFVLP